MKKILIKFKLLFPQLKWTMYEVNKKKYLVLYKIRFGRLVWSRHFLIEKILEDRGFFPQCEDEKRLFKFIVSSNK